ncbi:DUF4389 domain-containing protein [Lacisediminihabitans sp. H27-G8]|uniref:DUF4389 domain-containing protein n=1 Tax=Lacisediminihabitans sp. H27-G8 TaxID=3111909 RepID=UPI0038FD3EF8
MSYPLRLEATLDLHLSRWLWIVKMFLAIPHYVILVVLNAAFVITSLIAGIAILATGRYPRALFDFNVGVLRWNWRVGFSVYAALGTDAYPPFTLAATDYPATLEVDYPERLSRPRVLIAWLLAIPHLIVVGSFVGIIMLYPWDAYASWQGGHPVGGYSVLNLLVVIAGVILLITGRYPTSLFEFLVGFSRWTYRVVAFVGLMTEVYPPFRLDAGGQEPDRESSSPASPLDESSAVTAR